MAGTKEFNELSKEYAESMFGCTLEELKKWKEGKCMKCEQELKKERKEIGLCRNCAERENLLAA